MVGVSSVMNIGRKALNTAQSALSTVSHNVGNANTPGYSRQEVSLTADRGIQYGQHVLGSGVSVAQIIRIHDPFIERELCREVSKKGASEQLLNTYTRIEDVFNEYNDRGLTKSIANFFNSFRQLSLQPESPLSRQSVISNSEILCERFASSHLSISEIQDDLDVKISAYVYEANNLMKSIAQYNEEIKKVEIGGVASANDLRDQRDVAIKALSEILDIRLVIDGEDNYNIDSEGVGTLVSKFNSLDLSSRRTPEDAVTGKREGLQDVFIKIPSGQNTLKVTGSITGGTLGSLLEARDKILPGVQKKMDELAEALAVEVNQWHRSGVGVDGSTEVDLFKFDSKLGASASLKVNDDLVVDYRKVAAGVDANSPGDNRIALAIADIQNKKVFGEGTATIEEKYHDFLSELSTRSNYHKIRFENQDDIVRQLDNYKLSKAGVNLDDEAINMIKYQQLYQAAAKLIQTSNEMLQTVLDLKR